LRSFDELIGLLDEMPDPRRAEGKLYKQSYVLLFSIPAVVTRGNSYCSLETFITMHRRRLNATFGLRWKRAPAHTAIRYILQRLDPKCVEQVFHRHAAGLLDDSADPSRHAVALDGKVPRRSFDNFGDREAAQLLHAFGTKFGLVPGAYRHRREIERDPRRTAIAWRVPYCALHRHPRCAALPKKPSRLPRKPRRS
jgi:hypothetical protein